MIPLLAVIPLLGGGHEALSGAAPWQSIGKAVAVIAGILLIGPRVARPLFRLVAQTGSRELFTALSLLIVGGMALLVSSAGMSMALGAFIGGVLLAESEYRHQLEIDIEPFKGLLMGLFFMSMDVGLCLRYPGTLALLALGVIALKFLVLYLLAIGLGLRGHQGWQLEALLCQGGEFGFVLFGVAGKVGVIASERVELLNAVIVISMVLTPLVLALVDLLATRVLRAGPARPEDVIADPSLPVIIAGYGRFGQVVGRLLTSNGFQTTLIDRDPDQIELAGRFGATVHYGDATRLDLLRAAGAAHARGKRGHITFLPCVGVAIYHCDKKSNVSPFPFPAHLKRLPDHPDRPRSGPDRTRRALRCDGALRRRNPARPVARRRRGPCAGEKGTHYFFTVRRRRHLSLRQKK